MDTCFRGYDKHYVGGTRPRVPLDGQTSLPIADAAHEDFRKMLNYSG